MRWFVIMAADDRFYVRFSNTHADPEWTHNVRRAARFRGEEAAKREAERYLPGWRVSVIPLADAEALVA